MSKLAMKGVPNENTCGYLVSTIMPTTLQTGALICTQESTPTSTVLMNNPPIKCESLYFAKASTAFKNTDPFWEDTMKLMSGWCAGSVYPSETILTPHEGHVVLIGSRILSTSFFALTNNVVLSFLNQEAHNHLELVPR